MSRKSAIPEEKFVTVWFILIAVGVFASGVVLVLLAAANDIWKGRELWQAVVRQLGNSLLTTVALSLLWQLFGRRAFLAEVLAKVSMSKELTFAGIKQVTDSFHHEIDWPAMFRSTTSLDVFFAYGQTWRANNVTELRDLAMKPNGRIRVVLPDPDDASTVSELAKRFSSTPDAVRERIREAEKHFTSLRAPAGKKGAHIEIYFIAAAPLFTFYRFDNEAILALYNHRAGKEPVPTFVVQRGGTLWEYLKKEFHGMIDKGGLARRAASS